MRSWTPVSPPSKHCQRCLRSVRESTWCTAIRAAHGSFGAPNLQDLGSPFQVRAPFCGGRPQGPQSSQRSSGFHKPALSGTAPETATSLRPRRRNGRRLPRRSTQCIGWRCYCGLRATPRQAIPMPLCGSPQTSFVRKSRRGGTGRRLRNPFIHQSNNPFPLLA